MGCLHLVDKPTCPDVCDVSACCALQLQKTLVVCRIIFHKLLKPKQVKRNSLSVSHAGDGKSGRDLLFLKILWSLHNWKKLQ